MERKNFFKSLLGLIIAPKLISEINWQQPHFHNEPSFVCGWGWDSKLTRGTDGFLKSSNERTTFNYNYDHKTNSGTYTAHLKNGDKISFPINEFNPKKWQHDYGYLSDIDII